MSETIEVPGELAPAGGMGHIGAAAIRKVGRSGWTPFKWERIGNDSLLMGGIEGRYKNGKRKWSKPYTQVVVTASEVCDEEARYERDHARCYLCFGRGQEWEGWSASGGNRYRECSRCKGAGRPAERSP